jgi:hypothetical protein
LSESGAGTKLSPRRLGYFTIIIHLCQLF